MQTKLVLFILVLSLIGCSLGPSSNTSTEEEVLQPFIERYPTCTYSLVSAMEYIKVYLWRDSMGSQVLKVVLHYHREVGWYSTNTMMWIRPEDVI